MLKPIQERLLRIKERIVSPTTRLVAVSKTKPNQDILDLYEQGHRNFGENYVVELVEKQASLPADIQWHFIGTLQSNKCKLIAQFPNLFLVETIDSIKKAQTLNKACAGRLEPLGILLQVNTSGETSKGGIEPQDCIETAKTVLETCPFLKFKGLMTIGSVANSGKVPNPDFQVLNECKAGIEAALNLSNLEMSMGMSDDFETAVEQGSTSVRVGSSIFGSRN